VASNGIDSRGEDKKGQRSQSTTMKDIKTLRDQVGQTAYEIRVYDAHGMLINLGFYKFEIWKFVWWENRPLKTR